MHYLIIFLPLVTIIYVIFFNRLLGTIGTANVLITSIGLVSLISWSTIVYGIKENLVVYVILNNWVAVDLLLINWAFCFDLLTNVMIVIITTISLLVHVYSVNYLYGDPHKSRFITYLTVFTFFMIMLVTSNNFVQFFLSWEGVGICSFLLINFWTTRIQANKAALKALVMNRVGDVFLLLGIILTFILFKTLDFNLLLSLFSYFTFKKITISFGYEINYLNTIIFCLFIGAVGKSAQLGLHTWLPDAMEGPTPVSALLHAATMVTAGIFLLLRCSFLFEYSVNMKSYIVVWGVLTAFFSASIACVQTDLKKIIAYSTCSQLGYMTFTVGISQYQISLFHLFNHAFFKGLLFLSAGIIIHNFADDQDIRKTGRLQNLLPALYIINVIATIAITGFPFLSGFYSKDVIIETAYSSMIISNAAIYWLAVTTTLLTAFYSFKILLVVFHENMNSARIKIEKIHPISNFLFIPVIILSLFSCFIGFITKDLFIGFAQNVFEFTILPENYALIENEFISIYVKLIPITVTVLSIILLIYISKNLYVYKKIFITPYTRTLISFLNQKWYIDNIFNRIAYITFQFSYKISYKLLDKNIFEHVIVQTAVNWVIRVSIFILQFNSGLIVYHISLLGLALIFFVSVITL